VRQTVAFFSQKSIQTGTLRYGNYSEARKPSENDKSVFGRLERAFADPRHLSS
jgi:hypothetical protein